MSESSSDSARGQFINMWDNVDEQIFRGWGLICRYEAGVLYASCVYFPNWADLFRLFIENVANLVYQRNFVPFPWANVTACQAVELCINEPNWLLLHSFELKVN